MSNMDIRLNGTFTLTSRNVCRSIEEHSPQDAIGRLEVRLIFGFVYAVIFSVGFVGNTLVIYALIKHCMSFHGIRREFIFSLTAADILIATTSLPVTSIQTFLRTWIFGPFACRVVPFLQGIGVFSTSFTLVAIAIDRFRLIVLNPAPTRLTRRGTGRCSESRSSERHWPIILLIWFASGLLSAPYGLFLKLEQPPTICGEFCMEQWPMGFAYGKTYGMIVFVLQFLLPMLISSFCYGAVYHRVKMQTVMRQTKERLSIQTEHKINKRRRRVLLMACLMLISFLGSWLPMNTLNISRDFGFSGHWIPKRSFAILFAVAHCLAMGSIVWNPIIYSFCNQQFRELLCMSRAEATRRNSRCGRAPNVHREFVLRPQPLNNERIQNGIQRSLEEITSPFLATNHDQQEFLIQNDSSPIYTCSDTSLNTVQNNTEKVHNKDKRRVKYLCFNGTRASRPKFTHHGTNI